MQDMYRQQARQAWTQARHKALWSQLQASLSHKKIELIDLTEPGLKIILTMPTYNGDTL